MRLGDRDPAVRQFERDAVVACLGMALAALAVRGGRPDGAIGVLLGGLLAAVSYHAIKGGVDALLARRGTGTGGGPETKAAVDEADRAAPPGETRERRSRPRAAWQGAKFIGRYALLALAAYVMLTRFRAHPVGILCGGSSPVLAAAAQIPRLWRRGARLR